MRPMRAAPPTDAKIQSRAWLLVPALVLGPALGLESTGCRSTTTSATLPGHPMSDRALPEFSIPVRGGGVFETSRTRGRVLIVEFWAPWCKPCEQSFPLLEDLYERYRSAGLAVVAITEDDDEAVPGFLSRTGATFTIGTDVDNQVARDFGVSEMPASFLVDRRGVVRHVHVGYRPTDRETLEQEIEALLGESP